MKPHSLLLAASFSVQAQLALFSFNGTTEMPVGSTYSFGCRVSGEHGDCFSRAEYRQLGGDDQHAFGERRGFHGSVNGPIPYTVAPSNYLGFTVQFNASVPGVVQRESDSRTRTVARSSPTTVM